MIMLTPGVFIKQLPAQLSDMVSNKGKDKHKKMYPIEMFVGGNIANIGIEPVILS